MDNFVDNSNNLTDWTGSAVNSTYALATGTDPFQHYDVFFDGDMTKGLTTIMVAWSDNVLGDFAGAFELTYNMGQWALVNSGGQGDDLTFLGKYSYDRESAPVPEPTTIFLFGSGFAALAFYRWRHKKV